MFIPETDRGTLCVSSQAGCAVGCRFCSTGHQGFSRNLSSAEIIGQLWFAEHRLRGTQAASLAGEPKTPTTPKLPKTGERQIDNVVMMGMGEPLQNYAALLPALRTMLDDHAYGLSRRRVTVSTSGVVPMIERLMQDCPVALAVSLHAPNDALRDGLVPLNRKYPIKELLAACRLYLAAAPRDFITLEYCMLDGVNDSPELAHELVHLVHPVRLGHSDTGRPGRSAGAGLACKLNLIPFNPFPASGLRRSPSARVQAFAKILQDAGIVTTVRKTRGDDIDAACGQLAGEVQDRTGARERMAQRRLTVPIVPIAVPVAVAVAIAAPMAVPQAAR